MLEKLVTIGTLIALIYGFYNFLKNNPGSLNDLKRNIFYAKNSIIVTYKYSKIYFIFFILILTGLIYALFKNAWKLYIYLSVIFLLLYTYFTSDLYIKDDAKEHVDFLLNYYKIHLEIIEYLSVYPAFYLYFFICIILVGSISNFILNGIFKNETGEFREEIKKLNEQYDKNNN